LIAWHSQRAERIAERYVLERHMAAVAASLADMQREAAAATAGGPPVLALLDGAADPIAGAALQGLVQEMADKSDVSVTSTEMLPASQSGPYRRIGLHVSVYSPRWPTLVQLLQSIEQATPRMQVDDLQIHGLPARLAGDGPPIDASFSVFAFRAAEPSRNGE
ncbi:MAG TPA: type II secretion system protein GspM, partial [Acetobacteraceae bacterium]|nr:type II secretion system protein GspM [Acetobacteraceae bacterium]